MSIVSCGRVIAALFVFACSSGIAMAQDATDRLEICQSCHGDTGTSEMPGVPSLAGRPASELAAQLNLFRSGQRQNPQMAMAKRLTDDEVQALTAFFAKQPAK